MTLKCIVVEDEAIARKGLVEYIRQVDVLDLQGVFKNAIEANTYVQENDLDLIFLDIEMPQIDGLQFLRILKKNVHVIFTTAYSKFALQSFEFDVIDYLLKPISFERFLQAVNKSMRLIDPEGRGASPQRHLFVKDGTEIKRVEIANILYVEAQQNYVKIHTEGGTLMTLMTLKDFASQLYEENFVQTHRSYIVNVDKVTNISGDHVYFSAVEIPISKRMRAEFYKKIKK